MAQCTAYGARSHRRCAKQARFGDTLCGSHTPRNAITDEPDRPRPEKATRNVEQIVAGLGFEGWMREGACVGADPDVFITEGDEDDDPWYPSPAALRFCNL